MSHPSKYKVVLQGNQSTGHGIATVLNMANCLGQLKQETLISIRKANGIHKIFIIFSKQKQFSLENTMATEYKKLEKGREQQFMCYGHRLIYRYK